MKDQITAGAMLIEQGTVVPDSLLLETEPFSNGWGSLTNLDCHGLERELTKAGWTLFFMAGEIKTTVFGFDRQKIIRTAVKRLIANVGSRKLNCFELTRVAATSFLGVPYVNVFAHSRHIQRSSALSGR